MGFVTKRRNAAFDSLGVKVPPVLLLLPVSAREEQHQRRGGQTRYRRGGNRHKDRQQFVPFRVTGKDKSKGTSDGYDDDHAPNHPDDKSPLGGSGRVSQAWAFQFGYIIAMIQAVNGGQRLSPGPSI